MKIRELQRAIEESLENLPLSGFRPKASVYHTAADGEKRRKKVLESADASSFDPETCELVIGFEPIPDSESDERNPQDAPSVSADLPDSDLATKHILESLRTAERICRFVGLKWFRDQYMPNLSDKPWARDRDVVGALIEQAIANGLIDAKRVFDPNSPNHPIVAIYVNPEPRKSAAESRRERAAEFKPIRLRGGGTILDTLLDERRGDWR